MLKRVSDLPPEKKRGKESYVEGDVREFCRNRTYDVAEVEIEGHEPGALYKTLRSYLAHHRDMCRDVRVTMRNGRVFLYREVSR